MLVVKREIAFGAINGLKYIMKHISQDGEINAVNDKTDATNFSTSDNVFPHSVIMCSKMTLLLEKRLAYVNIFYDINLKIVNAAE
jgi:hypothetical protein